jgi:hypothetical protein
MREIAMPLLRELQQLIPVVFDDVVQDQEEETGDSI